MKFSIKSKGNWAIIAYCFRMEQCFFNIQEEGITGYKKEEKIMNM